MKRIPLHCLVVMVGPAGGGKTWWAGQRFSPYEILSSEEVRHELTGDYQRTDVNDVVFREIYRRTQVKLELGERVVVDATNLRKRDRMGLADIAIRAGVPTFYVICDRPMEMKEREAANSWRRDAQYAITRQDQIFNSAIRDILRGDGVANVIDTRQEDFRVVEKLPSLGVKGAIEARGYRGLMVIGDVHGMIEPLKNATEWATQRNLFCVFLGDILDYGPGSIECVDHVYEVITRGRGLGVMGNHERKIARWLDQVRYGEVRVNLSEGNKTTTRLVEAMPHDVRRRFEVRYRALMGLLRHHWVVGDTLFAHGAAEPAMFSMDDHRLYGYLETMALFGEVDKERPSRADGYPNRTYEWVNRVPKGHRVMVGHDIRSTTKPLVVQGSLGGEAYFMDTGSGKGGRLTSADVMFQDDALVIKNFNFH